MAKTEAQIAAEEYVKDGGLYEVQAEMKRDFIEGWNARPVTMWRKLPDTEDIILDAYYVYRQGDDRYDEEPAYNQTGKGLLECGFTHYLPVSEILSLPKQ